MRARRELEEIVAYIQADSPVDATRWRQRLERKMQSLRTMPEGCAAAPENERMIREIRQLLHGRYRVLFTIDGTKVFVLTIRHGARQFLAGDELDSIA